MLIHEFITVATVPDYYSILDMLVYDRDKMVKIDDNFILEHHVPIRKVKMHCSRIGNIIDGLSYHGITILDPQMATNLKVELLPFIEESEECKRLIAVLDEAISQNKYIIHFGI
jgi:hypothetical protein